MDRKSTQLKQEEAARLLGEQAAAEAQRLLEGIPQIAWTADTDGNSTYLNRRWFDFTGQVPDASPNELWQARIHPTDMATTEKQWPECLRTNATFEIEYRFQNQAGDHRWMLGRALPMWGENGAVQQ